MSLYPGFWMQINIALVPGVTSVENFSTPLFFTPDAQAPASVTFYGSLSELPAGVGATLTGAVTAALAQRNLGPALNQFAVARRLADVAQIDLYTTPAAPGTGSYSITLTTATGTATYTSTPAAQAQVDTIVTPAVPGIGTYTYTQAAITIEVDSDPALTQAQLRDAFVAQINGDVTLAALITAAPSGDNVTITADVPGTAFTAVLGGTAAPVCTISTTTPNITKQQDLRDDLVAAIQGGALAVDVTAAVSGLNLTITSDNAGVGFTSVAGGTATPAATVATTTPNRNMGTQIAGLAVTPGWYAFCPLGAATYAISDKEIADSRLAIQSLTRKIGLYQTASADSLTSGVLTDPASVAKAADDDLSWVQHESTDKATVAGLAGRWLPYPFDTALASPQRMKIYGNAPDTSYSEANVTTYCGSGSSEGKGGNLYVDVYGAGGAIAHGRMSSGVFARIIRGVHWLDNKLEVDLFTLFYKRANMGRPIVNVQSDLEAIGDVVKAALQQATRIGLFNSMPEVGVPKSADLDSAEVAAGRLTGFAFNGLRANEFIDMILSGSIE